MTVYLYSLPAASVSASGFPVICHFGVMATKIDFFGDSNLSLDIKLCV